MHLVALYTLGATCEKYGVEPSRRCLRMERHPAHGIDTLAAPVEPPDVRAG
jgi:hypothetical protein